MSYPLASVQVRSVGSSIAALPGPSIPLGPELAQAVTPVS